MAMLARIDASATEPTNGSAADTVSPRLRSTRPSRTSWTAFTSAACSRKTAKMVKISPMKAPMEPAAQLSSALMAAITR